MEEVDCVVVGAGVVGLAVARALAMVGREVIILEAAEGIGTETSSRNSEVIHAGIYYPANSLMAHFCVAGRRKLYAYCAEKGVPHINCGKLIVATSAQEDGLLAGIKQRAETNGVEGMRVLTAAEAIALEPNLVCTSALLSPINRDHRQPCLHGGAARRRRERRRGAGILLAGAGWPGGRPRDRARCRRRRSDDAALPVAGQLGRPACAGIGRADTGNAAPTGCPRRITRRAITSRCPAGRRSPG